MLFKAELAQKIVEGNKTQTRRPIKPGERLIEREGLMTIVKGRIKYQQGRDYAVQGGGRGASCSLYHPETLHMIHNPDRSTANDWTKEFKYREARILITDIRCEDVREISADDSIAEGFKSELEFLATWCGFYDDKALLMLNDDMWSDAQKHVWLAGRPDALYQAWAYTFEIAEV